MKVRALLDSASSASFVSEYLVKGLWVCLVFTRTPLYLASQVSLATLRNQLQTWPYHLLKPVMSSTSQLSSCFMWLVTYLSSRWNHLNNLSLADPDFGRPGRICCWHFWSIVAWLADGSKGFWMLSKLCFDWVLAGPTNRLSHDTYVTSHHFLVATGDDLLRKFWEIEESTRHAWLWPLPGGKFVVQHFEESCSWHCSTTSKTSCSTSWWVALSRCAMIQRSLPAKGEFQAFDSVILCPEACWLASELDGTPSHMYTLSPCTRSRKSPVQR